MPLLDFLNKKKRRETQTFSVTIRINVEIPEMKGASHEMMCSLAALEAVKQVIDDPTALTVEVYDRYLDWTKSVDLESMDVE